jgi:tetratricopeptide (TPR) repeat protein
VRRLQEDEVYQTRLKAQEDAVRRNPGNPDQLVELAEFLTREAQARYDRHTLGGQFRLLRPEVPRDPEGEFARAEKLADQALALNPQHAPAPVAKARVRFVFHQFGDADQLLQRALKIQENVPDGLELYARVVTIGASQAEASARNLETPQSGSSFGYNVIVYWTRYPTPAELRAAEEFRAIARQRLDHARQIFERAIQLRPNDGSGYYDLALWRLQQQDLPGAQEALQKAVQLAPGLVRARQALAKVYGDLGMKQEAYQEESILITQSEGGVSTLLAQAAKHMERTAWKTADEVLNRAAQADPVDARVAAYQGIIRLANQKTAEAQALWRMGLALEDARLQPLGITGKQESVGTRNPDEVALLMILRLRLAGLKLQSGQLAETLELARNNIALEKRIAVTDRLRDLPTTILPDVNPKPFEHPEPENAASLLAWSHYYAGQALRGLKRRDEAAQHFQAAHAAGRSLTVGQGTRSLNEPRNRAGLALGWILLERGDVNVADRLMREVDTTVKHSGSKELAAQKIELQQAIWKMMKSRSGSGRP